MAQSEADQLNVSASCGPTFSCCRLGHANSPPCLSDSLFNRAPSRFGPHPRMHLA